MSPSIANLKADLSKPRSYWIRYRAPDDWWSGCQLAWCRRWVGVAIKNIILYAWKQTTVKINLQPCYVHVCLMSFPVIDLILSLAMYAKSSSSRVCVSWKYTIVSVILLGNRVDCSQSPIFPWDRWDQARLTFKGGHLDFQMYRV